MKWRDMISAWAPPIWILQLASMYDGIEYRGYGQEIVEELAKYSKVPVWNGLTNEFHPTQMLADLLTIREQFGYVKGIKLSFFGDCRYNMANSWMVAGAKMGMHRRTLRKALRVPMSSTRTCGYPWESRWKPGRRGSKR